MNQNDEIKFLVKNDPVISYKELCCCSNDRDPLHVNRKKQQRAINNDIILIALHYGRRKRTYQDLSYTILDRSLINTPYEKHLNKLRGLTVIGNWEGNEFNLITAYWNFIIKSRKRY